MPSPERAEPARVVEAIETLLSALFKAHPELIPSVATLAEWVAQQARTQQPQKPAANNEARVTQFSTPQASTPLAPTPPAAPRHPIPAPPPQLPRSAAFVPLKFADNVLQVKVPGTTLELAAARSSVNDSPRAAEDWQGLAPPDLALIARRCDLKAAACGPVIARRAAVDHVAEQEHHRRITDLIAQAKQTPDTYLWMTFRDRPQPSDELLLQVEGAYRNLAAAARLVERVPTGSSADRRRQALQLLAEAQSALRVAISAASTMVYDRDQNDAYQFLHETTRYESIFLARFMRIDDAADPANWEDLHARLAAFVKDLEAGDAAAKRTTNLLNKVAYHVKQIANNAPQEAPAHWQRIESALVDLAAAGVRPEDQRVIDRLLPIARQLPAPGDDSDPLANVRAALAPPPEADIEEPPAGRDYSENVLRVRDMLRDSRVVLVGGERRDDAAERIREAFDLSEVEWATVNEHTSSTPLEAPIRRPETRLVLILIRLAGHLHVDDVVGYCEKWDKPLVRLPAGYNPEQIAAQILEQVSERLEIT